MQGGGTTPGGAPRGPPFPTHWVPAPARGPPHLRRGEWAGRRHERWAGGRRRQAAGGDRRRRRTGDRSQQQGRCATACSCISTHRCPGSRAPCTTREPPSFFLRGGAARGSSGGGCSGGCRQGVDHGSAGEWRHECRSETELTGENGSGRSSAQHSGTSPGAHSAPTLHAQLQPDCWARWQCCTSGRCSSGQEKHGRGGLRPDGGRGGERICSNHPPAPCNPPRAAGRPHACAHAAPPLAATHFPAPPLPPAQLLAHFWSLASLEEVRCRSCDATAAAARLPPPPPTSSAAASLAGE